MSLNKDTLGMALYNAAEAWNNKEISEIGDVSTARKNFWEAVADVLINHIKNNAVLTIPGTGLIAPSGGGAVTGQSTTGSIS